ncbi:MAG: hypothetical protein V3U84_05665 [Thiotrichaceae bacterium]
MKTKTKSFHGMQKKQSGFIAMPAALVVMALGWTGASIDANTFNERERVNYDIGTSTNIPQQQAVASVSGTPTINEQMEDFFDTAD